MTFIFQYLTKTDDSDKNGDLILDSKGISPKAFLQVAKFMNRVNDTLPRSFYRGRSRPMLQQLNLSVNIFQQLKALFFDEDGSLRRSMSKDIDTSLKHGYINFRNLLCLDERRDERWQVPVKQQKSSVHVVSTRKAVERLLSGVINRDVERLGDVGLLIGGTEDQSLPPMITATGCSGLSTSFSNANISSLIEKPATEIPTKLVTPSVDA